MKRFINIALSLVIIAFFTACSFSGDHGHDHESAEEGSHDDHHENAAKPTSSTGSFGSAISADEALAASELPAMFEGKEEIEIKLVGNVESVCQMTGCWIDVDMGDDEIVHVTFKDDGFVLPKDAAGKTAVIEGVATYEEVPVKMLKNLAEEDGKSQEEIDAITEPKMEYTFVAKGVLLGDGNF